MSLERRLDKQGDFAANAIACGELCSGSGNCGAQELLVDLGQFARHHDTQIGPPDRL